MMQYSCDRLLKSNIKVVKSKPLCSRFFQSLLISLLTVNIVTVKANQLSIYPSESPLTANISEIRADQLPLSRIAYGERNISAAWYSGATSRYAHNVLGDSLEASQLNVETNTGKNLKIILPSSRVFEDLEPRIVDINADGLDEVIVIESDSQAGASLAVYHIIDSKLEKMASTPFIGTPYRWLNPLGVGDFDGDGKADIAAVITPHIGGFLRLYHLKGAQLSEFAEYSGVSTHSIGSTELGLGHVISASPRDRFLVPNRNRRALMVLEWTENGWHESARVTLPGSLTSTLEPIKTNRWRFQVNNGDYYEVQLN